MAKGTNELVVFRPSTVNDVCAALSCVGDRIALLADIFTGCGATPRNEDFQLSARGAEAIAEMLVDMDEQLGNARDSLKQESVPLGAE